MIAMHDFAGRVALITGGAGAIGQAVAAALRERGAQVVAADRSGSPASLGGEAVEPLDVTDRRSVTALVHRIEQERGRLDILVNAAGVVSFGTAAELDETEWNRVLDVNLTGSFLACQAVIGPMRRRNYGRIVNLGSVVGKNGGNARPWLDPAEQQLAGNVAYGVSKAGVHMMTAFLARELAASGITVNAVAPGPIATGMTASFPAALRAAIPAGRMGTVADVSRAVLFLASDEAGFVSGEVLDVNGAMWCD